MDHVFVGVIGQEEGPDVRVLDVQNEVLPLFTSAGTRKCMDARMAGTAMRKSAASPRVSTPRAAVHR